MEDRHSSLSLRAASPRPRTYRKRSNSFPIVDALGCSTPEAELILAEGRAAIRSRGPSVHSRGRRKPPKDHARTFRPRDHVQYLYPPVEADNGSNEQAHSIDARSTRHTRVPSNTSNATDGSTSTITGPVPAAIESTSPTLPSDQLNYSANLAKFIQSQLNSIPTYKTLQPSATSPRSCPDLSFPSGRPPLSPRSPRRAAAMSYVMEMPTVRPPLKSAFSAWSSTDDEAEEDEVPPLPLVDQAKNDSKNNDTPSILGYYENTYSGSFFLPPTPANDSELRHSATRGFSLPDHSALTHMSSDSHPTSIEEEYISSGASAQPQLTSSSAPSFSSTSTASYFDYKRPIRLVPDVKDRIIAATAPHSDRHKILTAISPYEGGALANVHDILVETQQRVVVEGLTFDLIRDLNLPDEGIRKIPTPC